MKPPSFCRRNAHWLQKRDPCQDYGIGRVFMWSAAGDMKYHALLEDARLKGVPVTCFALFGKRVANGYGVSLGRHGFPKLAVQEDVPSGVSWTNIVTTQGEKRFLVETTCVDDKSYAEELAFETYACVLQKWLACTHPLDFEAWTVESLVPSISEVLARG